jgi:mannose-6-phosphate isomerase-like protein (cupin superfamily)
MVNSIVRFLKSNWSPTFSRTAASSSWRPILVPRTGSTTVRTKVFTSPKVRSAGWMSPGHEATPRREYLPPMEFTRLPEQHDDIAPDGSEVRLLVTGEQGGMAHFRLEPHETSDAKQHRNVEELWYFVAGEGEMCIGNDVMIVYTGVSVRIPPRTRFQFRSTSAEPLEIIAVTMPPWPGADEAQDAEAWWSK